MNWESFIIGAMSVNILWTVIHWFFPRKPIEKELK